MRLKSLLRVTVSTLLTILFALAAVAQESQDLFYQQTVGRKEIDLSVRRPVVDLTGSVFEEKYGSRSGSQLYANFHHQGRFWIARIPTESIKSTYFVMSYFMPIAAHAFLRFETAAETPIELIAPMPDSLPEKGFFEIHELPDPMEHSIRMTNMVMSAEAQWAKDDKKAEYSLVRGALGNFVQIVRFMSLDDRMMEFFRNGNRNRQWRTNLTPEESSKVLRSALAKSQADGAKTFYNTLFYNCTTTAIDIVAEGAPPMNRDGVPFYKRLMFTLNNSIFTLSRAVPVVTGWWGLNVRGLVNRGSEINSLERDPALFELRESAIDRLLRERGLKDIGINANEKKKKYIESVLTEMGRPHLCSALFR